MPSVLSKGFLPNFSFLHQPSFTAFAAESVCVGYIQVCFRDLDDEYLFTILIKIQYPLVEGILKMVYLVLPRPCQFTGWEMALEPTMPDTTIGSRQMPN